MPTEMNAQDLKDAPALADQLVAILTKDVRPPAAVAAAALALAAISHLAECGPNNARRLFDHYYATLESAQLDQALEDALARGKET